MGKTNMLEGSESRLDWRRGGFGGDSLDLDCLDLACSRPFPLSSTGTVM